MNEYYRNIYVPCNGNIGSITISNSQEISFTINPGFWNFNKTILNFSMNIAGNSNINSLYFINTNYCVFFNRISLYTNYGNLYLIDIDKVDIYSKSLNGVLNYNKRDINNGFCCNGNRDIKSSALSLINYESDVIEPNPIN